MRASVEEFYFWAADGVLALAYLAARRRRRLRGAREGGAVVVRPPWTERFLAPALVVVVLAPSVARAQGLQRALFAAGLAAAFLFAVAMRNWASGRAGSSA